MNLPEDIIYAFEFLTDEFGFSLIDQQHDRGKYVAEYLLIYRNENSNVQLEICADEKWFHCEIRRIINGAPAPYNYEENSVGFEGLARMEIDNKYDRFDYIVSSKGLQKVLENTVSLLKRHREELTTQTWIDTKRIRKLFNWDFYKKHKFIPGDTPSFIEEVKNQLEDFMKQKEFHLVSYSADLPPFDKLHIVKHLHFQNSAKSVLIREYDWRDGYNIYDVYVDGALKFRVDWTKITLPEKAEDVLCKKVKALFP